MLWKEHISQVTVNEKTNMASENGWKPRMAEKFLQAEEQKEEKN